MIPVSITEEGCDILNNTLSDPRTVGEKMVEEMQKMTLALTQLHGVPKAVIIAYLRQRTHLPLKNIQSVLDGLTELNKEFRPK